MWRRLHRAIPRAPHTSAADGGDVDDVFPMIIGVYMLVLGGALFLGIDISQVLVQQARPIVQQIATILASESYPTASTPNYATGLVDRIVATVDRRAAVAVPPFSCTAPTNQPVVTFGNLSVPFVTNGTDSGATSVVHTVTVNLTCTSEWKLRGFDLSTNVSATETYAPQADTQS